METGKERKEIDTGEEEENKKRKLR